MGCSVKDCINKHKCRGYCGTHYKHILRYGEIKLHNIEQHGLSYSREYRSWSQMKARCLNANHHAYKNYGGRGIVVCNRWIDSFNNFLSDMGKRPVGKTLDRINPNGNYEPSNCWWATVNEQATNRRNNNPYVGVNFEKDKKTWRATLSYDGKKLLNKRFRKFEDALKARQEAEKMYISG